MGEIKTYTGIMFDPIVPEAEKIDIVDIAHALSMLCRGNGHMKHFYSVGQHSINCMMEAKARGYSQRVQLGCLLHDASEAYLSDVTRPVKAALPEYLKIEAPLQNAIWAKWLSPSLTAEEEKLVFEIDDAMLWHEFIPLMGARLSEEEPVLQSEPILDFMGFQETEQRFLSLFYMLVGDQKTYFTVGVDWMKPGWVEVELRDNEIGVKAYQTIDDLCAAYQDAEAILIDCPLGLPESKEESAQRPDQEARNYLKGKRKSSVFNILYRQIVYADTVQEAWELNRKLRAGMTVTGQALRPMIRQVDTYIQAHPEWQDRLMESHPEVVFQKLNHDRGLECSKHTYVGQMERAHILESYGLDIQPLLRQFSEKQREDVLDATVLALSAQLGCQNGFQTIPEHPAEDRTGLKMQIVYGVG